MKKEKLLYLEIKEKASTFRSSFGFGEFEPIHLKSFLLKNNIISLFRPLSGLLAGMAIKAGNSRFMMINHNHSIGKQHFTIAHELYHLFVQENFISQKCTTGLFDKQQDIEEKKADLFAANLLLPESGIFSFIPKEERTKKNNISENTLFKIQQYYSVSLKAVIYRLFQLELVDNSYFDLYQSGVKIKAKHLGYDVKLFEPGNQFISIGNYAELANKLLKDGKISESYFFELLNSIGIDPFDTNENGDEC